MKQTFMIRYCCYRIDLFNKVSRQPLLTINKSEIISYCPVDNKNRTFVNYIIMIVITLSFLWSSHDEVT